MKRDHINYLLAGTLVIVALLVGGYVLYRLSGGTGPAVDYSLQLNNVSGLKAGTPVYFEGYRVGQVTAIAASHNGPQTRFVVTVEIIRGWPIPADSIARLAASGLLADVLISISAGSAEAVLTPGSEIRAENQPDLFMALGALASDAQTLTRERIDPLLRLANERLDGITADLDRDAPEIVGNLNQALARIRGAAEGAEALLGADNRAAVEIILKRLDEAGGHIASLSADLHQSRAALDRTLDAASTLLESNQADVRSTVMDMRDTLAVLASRIEAISYHLETSSRNFNEFSREIRQQPSLLIFTPPRDDTRAESERK